MKFRSKLYLAFLLIILCTTFVSLGLVYWEIRTVVWEELKSKVLTVAATGAKAISGDALKKVQETASHTTPEFQQISEQMDQILSANKVLNGSSRKKPNDIFILWIYTIRPMPEDPSQLEIGIDLHEVDPNRYSYGPVPYPEGKKYGMQNHFNELWATPHLYTDRYGSFLSGIAPIYDSNGEYVASLGVDVSSKFVDENLKQLQLLAFTTLLFTMVAGFIAATFLSQFATRFLDEVCNSVQLIGSGDLKARVPVHSHTEFGDLAIAINTMAKSLERHERLKLNFIRYVSKHVMEKILTADMSAIFKGERRKITVLISDIRRFTKLSEMLAPEEVVSLLNEYLDRMIDVIFANNGTLDQFLGDGLLVEFGAPLDDPNQEKNAVKTAIEMESALQIFCKKLAQEGRPILEIGIGIHTGLAVVGNIGSEKRMEYTAIGDTVEIAFLLEDATKQFHVPLLISEASIINLKGVYNIRKVGSLAIPWKDEAVNIYTLEEYGIKT